MKYDILHELPGRMRVHCRHLRIDPDNRIELNRWVARHGTLVSAKLSLRTGNLLIAYSRTASRESVLLVLDDLRLFGEAEIGNSSAVPPTLAESAAAALARGAAWGVVNAFLPGPARRFEDGLALGSAAVGLCAQLANGRVAAFLFGALRLVLFGLSASSFPVRLLLMAGASVVQQRCPRLSVSPPKESLPSEASSPRYRIAHTAV